MDKRVVEEEEKTSKGWAEELGKGDRIERNEEDRKLKIKGQEDRIGK